MFSISRNFSKTGGRTSIPSGLIRLFFGFEQDKFCGGGGVEGYHCSSYTHTHTQYVCRTHTQHHTVYRNTVCVVGGGLEKSMTGGATLYPWGDATQWERGCCYSTVTTGLEVTRHSGREDVVAALLQLVLRWCDTVGERMLLEHCCNWSWGDVTQWERGWCCSTVAAGLKVARHSGREDVVAALLQLVLRWRDTVGERMMLQLCCSWSWGGATQWERG